LNLFDRYLLSEWLKMLALLVAATMGVLLMAAVYDKLRELLEVGVGLGDILRYFATLMPSYLSVVLPLSLLLSLLFVLSKLHRNNELTAMRTAGLNVFAVTRSLWLAGAFFCVLSLFLNARVIPWSVEESNGLLDSFEFRAEARKTGGTDDTLGLVSGVAFDNQRQNRMWYINRYSRYTEKAYGITVSELDRKRREKTRILAREGAYDANSQSWTFRDGREIWFDPELGEEMRTVTFTEKVAPNYSEDPSLMLLIDRKPSHLSFNELGRITDYFALENNPKIIPYQVRYYGVLCDTLGPLIIIAIAIPFAMSGVRVSPAVGVSKSIGLFLLYYLLSTLATMLGGRGIVEPMWAALMPNLTMIGVAAYSFGRMR
jgi:lipopolysaccharide export system permease protein